MKTKTILVVEDEADLRDLLAFNLQREGYGCRCAADGEEAWNQIRREPPALVILDRMLPQKSGDDVLTELRRRPETASIPVIMLTAKTEESDELVGFAMGADDYVTKPFSMKTLMARVGALFRRNLRVAHGEEPRILSSGAVTLDRERQEVMVGHARLHLTTTEFRLLHALIAADGRLRSRQQLIDAALGPDVAVIDRTIDVHIASLRKKLGPAATWIQTIRGSGYTWRSPDQVDE